MTTDAHNDEILTDIINHQHNENVNSPYMYSVAESELGRRTREVEQRQQP